MDAFRDCILSPGSGKHMSCIAWPEGSHPCGLPDTWPVFRHMHGSDMQTDVTRGGMVDVARQGWRKFATLEFPDVHLESRFVRHIGASSEPLMR